MVKVLLAIQDKSIKKLYRDFYETSYDSTGTILIHHGKAKYPGKSVKNYRFINLSLIDDAAEEKINSLANELLLRYNLNKVFVVHRLGKIKKNDTILFIGVEAKERSSAFDAVRNLLEYIKTGNLFKLEEF